MSNADLTLWFNEMFWPSYNALVKTPFPTKYRSGSRGEALKKILTLKPSAELQNRIAAALIEQRKHRKKLYEQCGSMQKYLSVILYEKFYSNRMCVTWINQMGWEDEIPPLDDMAQSKGLNFGNVRCQSDGCPNAIHGPSYIYCCEHEGRSDESDKALRQKLGELQLVKKKDESLHDYAMRCKKRALQLLRGLKNGMRMQK